MGLVGPKFVGGTGALAFLLAAEVVAATAAVSEAALVYVARHRNLMISLFMISLQAALTVALILFLRALRIPEWIAQALDLRSDRLTESVAAASPAIALMIALGVASILKAGLLSRLLGAPVSGWRWPLVWAAAAAVAVGYGATFLPEWMELAFGIPLILGTFGAVIWKRGFTQEDRVLFRLKRGEEPTLPPPPGVEPPGR